MRELTPRDTPCYCINFRRAANTLTKLYDKALSPFNITSSQFSLLNDIYALKTCNMTELAKYAGLDRTTITRNLKVLLYKGFIEDCLGGDSRTHHIKLTYSGKSVMKEGFVEWEKMQKNIKSTIGLENIHVLIEIFSLIESLQNTE